MRRYFAFLLLLPLLLLSACGYDAYDPALLGHYTGTTIDAEGYTIDMTSVYAGTNYIELADRGEGKLCLSNHVYDIEWGMNGKTLTLVMQGEKSKGTLTDGVLLLNYLDMGMELRFELDAAYRPLETMSRKAATTDAQKFWNGDWYGWWVIEEATGEYSVEEGNWRDLCADIYIDESGHGEMLLWDETYSRGVPLGFVELSLQNDGTVVSERGHFGLAEVADSWHIDPNAYEMENMLVIQGVHEDEAGAFAYTAYLRPWGQDWSDAQQKPYHYEAWYLPLIEEEKPMPDHIG